MVRFIVLSAPSGAGKTTIAKRLAEENPDFKISVSATTRSPRSGEKHGVDYIFLEEEDFQQKIENNDFIEYENVHGDYYGTIRSYVEDLVRNGFKVIFDIDVKGAVSIKNVYEDALLIFIKAPSLDELRKRLRERRSESRESIKKRLKRIEFEYEYAKYFDHVVVNKDLDDAIHQIEKIIRNSEMTNGDI